MELSHRTKPGGMTIVFLGGLGAGELAGGLEGERFGLVDVSVSIEESVELAGGVTGLLSVLSWSLLIVYTLGLKSFRLQLTTTSTVEPFKK